MNMVLFKFTIAGILCQVVVHICYISAAYICLFMHICISAKVISVILSVPENTKNSKYANLEYEVLKYNEEINLSVVKVHLHTGRHHQIRVQFSSRDHSIYGDQKYGGRGHGKQIALWAYSLSFYHPITREKMTFEVLPEINGTWKILEDVKLK